MLNDRLSREAEINTIYERHLRFRLYHIPQIGREPISIDEWRARELKKLTEASDGTTQ